ncbi:ABC transporter permease [Gordonia sp. SID5947]|uniref:ABC transporter permease n=1 Tax=Gordonia sp. SID5947 TaxID=2690315 RepID=UPI001F1DCA70|nr:ABC transporter permease [Gordonia sp. SID5947]
MVLDRLIWLVPMLFLVSLVTFLMLALAGGDTAATILGDAATPQAVAAKKSELGLDQGLVAQYVHWLGGIFSGDFGKSFIDNSSVGTSLAKRFPVTLALTIGGLLVAVVAGVSGGVLAALRPGGLVDRAITVLTSVALALPGFWIAMLLSLWIGVRLGWLPAGGYVAPSDSVIGWLQCLILPSLALGATAASSVARQMRAAMIVALESDYVRTARAKGMHGLPLIRRHVLRNCWGPVATIIGFQAATILGGSIVIEAIFVLPGIGGMVVPAVQNGDYPVIMGTVLLVAVVVLLVNLLVDLIYSYADPRVRA